MIISATQVISKACSNSNIDPALFVQTQINASEREWLRPILGEDFYDEIVTESQSSYSSNNQTLVDDYLLDFLAWAVYHDALPEITYQVSSQGILGHSPEFSSNTGRQGLQMKQAQALRNAESYKAKMIEFLCDNSGNYPLYDDDRNSKGFVGGVVCY